MFLRFVRYQMDNGHDTHKSIVPQVNFKNSKAKIVRLLRAVWLRKKHNRERKEWESRLMSHFHRNLLGEFS